MLIYKLMALAFLILTPIFSYVIVSMFKLNRYGLKFPDITLPLYALEIIIVSAKFFTHSLLPYYVIIKSILAITIASLILRKGQHFSYHRFLKLFWRSGFLITAVFYLGLVILVFII